MNEAKSYVDEKSLNGLSERERRAKYGPLYPDLGAGLAKHRRAARKGLSKMTPGDRHAYGEAVEQAVLARQRSELQRELPTHNVHCASGCSSPDGAVIHRHLQNKQRAALLACPSQERRARTDDKWREMYEEAMAEKRERIAAAEAAKKKPKKKKPAQKRLMTKTARRSAELLV